MAKTRQSRIPPLATNGCVDLFFECSFFWSRVQGSVQHDNSVTWLATWKDNVNGNVKYVFLAANSSLKGQSDFKKFEKVRVFACSYPLRTRTRSLALVYE